jgi:hypothetical protein
LSRKSRNEDFDADAKVKRYPSSDFTLSSPRLGSIIISPSTIFANQALPSPLPILQPNNFSPSAKIQGVQRNALLGNTHQLLADDVDRWVSTLRKAREAVLTRHGSKFSRRSGSKEISGANSIIGDYWVKRKSGGGEGHAIGFSDVV